MDQFWTYNLLLTILQYKVTAVIIAIAIIVDFIIKYIKAEQYFSVKDKFLYATATALAKFISFTAAIVLIAIGLEILTYFFSWVSSGSKW